MEAIFPIEKQLGDAKLIVDAKEGNFVFSLVYDGDDVDASLSFDVALIDLLEAAAKKTDTPWDDKIVDYAKGYLK